MKTKLESSKDAASVKKPKPKIYRFSIAPTLTKAIIFFVLLEIFYRFLFPMIIRPTFFIYVESIPTVEMIYRVRLPLFLVLIIVTLIKCLRTNSKKIRIKKGALMYRSGIICKRTKVFPLQDLSEFYRKTSLTQKIFKASTLTIILQKEGNKKLSKKLVFKSVKQADELMTDLMNNKP